MNGTATLKCEHIPPSSIKVSWIGGYQPVQLQSTTSVNPTSWQNVDGPTMKKEKTLPATGAMKFFRLMEAVPLLDATLTETETKLCWIVPELA